MTKTCRTCQGVKSLEAFHRLRASKDGRHSSCKSCRSAYQKSYRDNNLEHYTEVHTTWRRANPGKMLLKSAKNRATKRGLEFDLTIEDLLPLPTHCPILGLELCSGGRGSPSSYSLDRIDPAQGYVRDNVQVVSWRANKLKSDMTPEEIRLLASWISND